MTEAQKSTVCSRCNASYIGNFCNNCGHGNQLVYAHPVDAQQVTLPLNVPPILVSAPAIKCSWPDCNYEAWGICNFNRGCISRRGCGRSFCLDHKGSPGCRDKSTRMMANRVCLNCENPITLSIKMFYWIFGICLTLLMTMCIVVPLSIPFIT